MSFSHPRGHPKKNWGHILGTCKIKKQVESAFLTFFDFGLKNAFYALLLLLFAPCHFKYEMTGKKVKKALNSFYDFT